MRQIQISDQIYEQAKHRAIETGFGSVDEFIADCVVSGLNEPADDYDHFFTPEVIADLDQISASVKGGAQTYSQEEVDEHFRKKSEAWRNSHAN